MNRDLTMSTQRAKRLLTVAAGDPTGPAAFLTARLGLTPAVAARLLVEGAVFVGGKRLAAGATGRLQTGAKLTVYVAQATPSGAVRTAVPRVVYEDATILVVDKPAGLPSQPGRRGGPSLLTVLPRSLGVVHLIHRLDAEASGVLLLARDAAVCGPLQQALQRGEIEREYVAVVIGTPSPPAGSIGLRIGPAAVADGDHRSPSQQCFPAGSDAGLLALTRYETLRRLPPGPNEPERALLALRLETGRTHQIRAHLAAIGHPLVGDSRYGGPPAPRLFLHALRLRLRHPGTQEPMCFTTPLPAGFPPHSPE